MTIGEIEYTRFFTDQQLFSPTFSRVVFLSFCVMMPIVLMNLTVGTFSHLFPCIFLNSWLSVIFSRRIFSFFLPVYQEQKQTNHKLDLLMASFPLSLPFIGFPPHVPFSCFVFDLEKRSESSI